MMFLQTRNKIVEANNLRREVVQQRENLEKLNLLSAVLPDLTTEMADYLKTLPLNEAEVADFAAFVEKTARDLSLVITFHFDDFPKPLNVSGQNIFGLGSDMVVEGSFSGLTTFLSNLSAARYFFKIDKLTVIKHESKIGVKASISGALMMNIQKK